MKIKDNNPRPRPPPPGPLTRESTLAPSTTLCTSTRVSDNRIMRYFDDDGNMSCQVCWGERKEQLVRGVMLKIDLG